MYKDEFGNVILSLEEESAMGLSNMNEMIPMSAFELQAKQTDYFTYVLIDERYKPFLSSLCHKCMEGVNGRPVELRAILKEGEYEERYGTKVSLFIRDGNEGRILLDLDKSDETSFNVEDMESVEIIVYSFYAMIAGIVARLKKIGG